MALRKHHFELIGVSYGATEEEIKDSFRQRIKRHHPDLAASRSTPDDQHARELIEAYQLLLTSSRENGGRAWPTTYGNPAAASTAAGEATRQPDGSYYTSGRAAAGTWYYNPGADNPGYEQRTQQERWQGFAERFAERLHEEFARVQREERQRFRTGEATAGSASEATKTFQNFRHSPSSDRASAAFERAEEALHYTVERFNRQTPSRSQRRNYISQLTQIQVLYRDVANRHPSRYQQAMVRVGEIRRLVEQLKLSL